MTAGAQSPGSRPIPLKDAVAVDKEQRLCKTHITDLTKYREFFVTVIKSTRARRYLSRVV